MNIKDGIRIGILGAFVTAFVSYQFLYDGGDNHAPKATDLQERSRYSNSQPASQPHSRHKIFENIEGIIDI